MLRKISVSANVNVYNQIYLKATEQEVRCSM